MALVDILEEKTAEILSPNSPVQPSEIIRPTRVVYRDKNRFLSTRVFPTEARAYDFAAEQKEVVCVQNAAEPPPRQDQRVNRRFVRSIFDPDAER